MILDDSLVSNHKTDVLIVGGGYSGLAAVKALQSRFIEKIRSGVIESKFQANVPKILNITLVEPRAGLLNVLGMSKSMVNLKFAETQFVDFGKLNLPWDRVISKNKQVLNTFKQGEIKKNEESGENLVEITYIQGKINKLSLHEAEITLLMDEKANIASEVNKAKIKFNYCIMATGRDRTWPATPRAETKDVFLKEMSDFHNQVAQQKTICVIGAGAVGIEIAGDLKHHFPDKIVNIIHPYEDLPPENLTDSFKNMVKKSLLNAGVQIYQKRIDRELENGDLITEEGETINSNYNIWTNKFTNNVKILDETLQKEFVNYKKNVLVNEYLQLNSATKKYSHFFVIGDLVELPIIKSAGWAMYMGRSAANNIISLITTGTVIEPIPDLNTIPTGMVMVVGNGDIISEITGEASINPPHFVEEYKDYCFGKVRATLNM